MSTTQRNSELVFKDGVSSGEKASRQGQLNLLTLQDYSTQKRITQWKVLNINRWVEVDQNASQMIFFRDWKRLRAQI
jgi:hypothetical protein